jgi:hypothetical protein
MQTLTCAGNSGCTRTVAMIGSEGYAYCEPCGIARRMTGFERVRKLTPTERRRLDAGETISYRRQSNPKARVCPPTDPYANDTHERPCAAPGLLSYRARGRFGWIMIGARDDADAMREALRSTDKVHTLEKWDGTRYAPQEVAQ